MPVKAAHSYHRLYNNRPVAELAVALPSKNVRDAEGELFLDDIQLIAGNDVARLKDALAAGAVPQALSIWRAASNMLSQQDAREVAAAFTAAGDPDAADQVLAVGADNFPNDFWRLYDYAEHARRRGRLHDALQRYRTAKQRFPREPLGLVNEGQVLAQLGDTDGAEQAFAAACALGPDRFWPALYYARFARLHGRARQGVPRARELVVRFPAEPLGHGEYIETLTAAGMHESAAEAARVAAARFPDNKRITDLLAAAEVAPGGRIGSDVESVSLATFGTPRDLARTPTPLRRVLTVGACLTSGMPQVLAAADPPCPSDFVLLNHLWQLPIEPPHPAAGYDFMMVQLPLRSVIPDGAYFRLPHDVAACRQAFEDACETLRHMLQAAMCWNVAHGLLTFVWNFPVPQQNPMGRLLPRYDLRNMVFFVEQLNEALAKEIASYTNAHLFDLDQVLGMYGKWFFQDDSIVHLNHGAMFVENHAERSLPRLEALQPVAHTYPIKLYKGFDAIWAEIVAMYRTIRQVDMVKLVIMDIDDTLWRGVAAEDADHSPASVEGWPLGVIEALAFLKRRGVLLALVSKNDERSIEDLWPRVIDDNRLRLSDFVARKINWRSKAENIAEILNEVNLLPRSVLFIDDNPVERAAVQAAFPDIRSFGPNPYIWRRLLLWAPETQVATITTESAARTEMVQAQIERETQRTTLSREAFLRSLNLAVRVEQITGTDHAGFKRSVELINKTNQFNTTGKRWTYGDFVALFARGGLLLACNVTDRFTAYGIVGVLVLHADRLAQFVMSCRVIGMDVEVAIIADALAILADRGMATAQADFIETDANLLCRELWQQCGFVWSNGVWQCSLAQPLARPPHVNLVREAG